MPWIKLCGERRGDRSSRPRRDRMEFLRRTVVSEFVDHYHRERNHQGLGNQLITPSSPVSQATGEIRRRQRLGGMLNYYYREAA